MFFNAGPAVNYAKTIEDVYNINAVINIINKQI
jgi:hypothetical protein